MTEKTIAYFRRRARYHLAKSALSDTGIALIHRRFAQLYSERAARLDETCGSAPTDGRDTYRIVGAVPV